MKEVLTRMKSFFSVMLLSVALTLMLITTGCVTEQTTTNTAPVNTNIAVNATPTPSASPSTIPVSEADANALPVTLPVLDAFFADEKFANELKTKLQLTDEQINKLRTIAHEETAKLRSTNAEQREGSTAQARTLAADKIKEAIGEEKAQQLFAFVRERWNNGSPEESASSSNERQPASSSNSLSNKPSTVPQDTRIVVNTPAYRMDVFEQGKLVKSYKIGIGYPEFPLPTGLRKARTIIFNPTWTAPDSPWMASFKDVEPGEKVEAGSKLNPLGLIKIPIGSPSLIHGGKSPAKLGGFASHGCVGLTNTQVQGFAKLLAQIGGANISDADIKAYEKNRTETKDVKLPQAVPVELRYETITVEDGRLHIYRDVYDHDTNTEANLRKVLEAYGVTLDQLSEAERAQVMNALKEMSRDASGKMDQANTASPSNKKEEMKQRAEQNKVTRTVKGKKEIVIEIAALKDKGYPAPVDLDTGTGTKKTAAVASSSQPTPNKRR